MSENKIVSDFLLFSSLLSSSSDEDEEDQFCAIKTMRTETPKIKNFIENVVYRFNNKQFKKHFRLELSTAEFLINKFKESQFGPKNEQGGRNPISAEAHVLSFLWFACNKASIREVALLFDMSESSLIRVSDRVMDFLLNLAPSIIQMPNSPEEKEFLEQEFKKVSGFFGALGCIDGTSIHINTPAHKIKSTYVNRHDTPSITLQAICDHRRRFLDVFTGIPGKVHDARVFKMSDVAKKLPILCGEKYHLLGDGAYPLRSWLMTPYKDFGKLTKDEEIFNKKFSATRVLIENSFGILKGRFRQLLRVDMRGVLKITRFIISCCVLHNICIDFNDVLDEKDIINNLDEEQDPIAETEIVLRRKGETKRNYIKDSFKYN